MNTEDPYELERFVAAQEAGGHYERALAELRGGRKVTHWIWFVFPQVAGLGHSEMSKRYAIRTLDEARAYLRHPVLGPRLIESATIVANLDGVSAHDVFGEIDARKLRSSMTLFLRAAPDESVFGQVLDHWFDGMPNTDTERLL